ncbi:MAG: polysaccharide deacetylase family protein [Chloroflexi bacterium]|nr:polysaccharide deacetylase family protein [Chloroflexota bacterium]
MILPTTLQDAVAPIYRAWHNGRALLFLCLLAAGLLLTACQTQTGAAEGAMAQLTAAPTAAGETAVPSPTPLLLPPAPSTAPPSPIATMTAEPSLIKTPTLSPTAMPTASPTAMPPIASSLIAGPPPALPTPQGIYSRTLRVPILMYHYLSTPPADADIYRTDLSTEPEMFRQQMAYLAANGYTPIDFYDLSLAIVNELTLPDKPVILTFDDGYLDNYQNAFPVLQAYGFTATFFVITDFVDRELPGYMTWDMLKEMAAAGMRIESHSRNHPDLSGKSRDFVIYQLLGSQETLAAHLGYTPRYFCYPSGRYDETTMAILQEVGYWGAVTTQGGRWQGFTDRYEWSRMRIRHATTLPEFITLVDPGNTRGGNALP